MDDTEERNEEMRSEVNQMKEQMLQILEALSGLEKKRLEETS